jgi:hypothetical protein
MTAACANPAAHKHTNIINPVIFFISLPPVFISPSASHRPDASRSAGSRFH